MIPGTEIPGQQSASSAGHSSSARRPRPSTKPRRCFFAIKASGDSVLLPRLPPLGFLTQAKLFRQAQAGDRTAKQQLWELHARLSYTVVNRFRVRTQDVPDAIQAAVLGLPRAIEKFELARLNEFSTYAYQWVRQSLLRHREQTSFFVKIPAGLLVEYRGYRRDVVDAENRSAWFDARSARLDANPLHYRSLIRLHGLAEPQPISAALSLTSQDTPLTYLVRSEIIGGVNAAVATLSKRERKIISLRYGLTGDPAQTLEEIGQRFRLTRERVRQIQQSAEGRLRRTLKPLFPEWAIEDDGSRNAGPEDCNQDEVDGEEGVEEEVE